MMPILHTCRSQINQRVDELCMKIQRDSVILLYYSGHGIVRSGHMCMVGVEPSTTNYEQSYNSCQGSSTSVENVINKILGKAAGCRLILILDMCRSNAGSSSGGSRAAIPDGLESIFDSKFATEYTNAMQGLTSCGLNRTMDVDSAYLIYNACRNLSTALNMDDDGGRNGMFTKYLLEVSVFS